MNGRRPSMGLKWFGYDRGAPHGSGFVKWEAGSANDVNFDGRLTEGNVD